MKKLLSVILCLAMLLSVFSVVPFNMSAAETDVAPTGAKSGTTGDCTWTLDGTELTISGNGRMGDYDALYGGGPWGSDITKVTILKGVTNIGEDSFYDCTDLTNVIIGDSVKDIGYFAFSGCTGLMSISIPNSVTNIGVCSFGGCTGLTSVTIPNSVTSIDGYAFYDCTGLMSVTIPNSVTSIGNNAFENCTSLTSVTIPHSITSISKGAFRWCTGLKKVTIPDSITSIGSIAFNGCTGLTKVKIPNSVTRISEGAFSICDRLSSVTIPTSVTSIGDGAFIDCRSLKSVTIPASVISIDKEAFGYYFGNNLVKLKVSDFTIKGYFGTAAEAYANNNALTFNGTCVAPKLTKVQNASNGVNLAWNKSSGAAKYRVFRKSGSGSFAKLMDTTALSIVDKTAKSGTKYTYTVRCIITKDGKGYTSAYDKNGKSILYLAQPKITKLENAAKGTKLTWSKSGGAASYRVYLKSGSSWKTLGTVEANTYTYTKAKSGATYTYTVCAVGKDGKTLSAYNTKGWSKKFIAAPALPTLKNTKNGVQITFKKSAGAEKYRVFRKVENGKYAKLADTTKLTVLDKTAKNGKTYSYTVRCISKDGKTYTSAYNAAGKSIKCKR